MYLKFHIIHFLCIKKRKVSNYMYYRDWLCCCIVIFGSKAEMPWNCCCKELLTLKMKIKKTHIVNLYLIIGGWLYFYNVEASIMVKDFVFKVKL